MKITNTFDHNNCDTDHDDNGLWFCLDHQTDICFGCKLTIAKGEYQCGRHMEPDYNDYLENVREQESVSGLG